MATRIKTSDLASIIESLRDEVAQLAARLEALEATKPSSSSAAGQREAPPKAPLDDEQLLAAVSAALAAYLGVRPRIRQIRLVGGESWVHQGRVTIQAGHVMGR
jgi:methylmalonyl-CoA carboxyltransferase large subunit